MNHQNWKALANQLRKPHGKEGVEVAKLMNETNIQMTCHSIDRLNILDNNRILELGHGNCKHLEYLLNQKANLTFCGLETSSLMKEEAERINRDFANQNKASFHLYEGMDIPFADNSFDRVFTVNTIYFWENPKYLFTELCRVIKPEGLLNITFASKEFMKDLPFTQYGFDFYDKEKITHMINDIPFKPVAFDTRSEIVKSKSDAVVNREFATITIKKTK